jgi:hypothetical protein
MTAVPTIALNEVGTIEIGSPVPNRTTVPSMADFTGCCEITADDNWRKSIDAAITDIFMARSELLPC